MEAGWIKKNGVTVAAVLMAAAGMVIYLVTSMTGYLASSAVNPWPVVCTVAAVVMLVVSAGMGSKMTAVMGDILVMAASVLLLVSFYYFVLARVQLAADVYFIPVNYPASEATALHISVAGAVLYLLADIAVIVKAFSKKTVQE
ncbi:MAG: sodium:proton antiporter [Hungatella hathewayi]|nr:sodium:proton antiporter [Hungatella hathewayi]